MPDYPDAEASAKAVSFDVPENSSSSSGSSSNHHAGPSTGSKSTASSSSSSVLPSDLAGLSRERAARLRDLYLIELAGRCKPGEKVVIDGSKLIDRKGKAKAVDWDGFVNYADEKEQGEFCLLLETMHSCTGVNDHY